MEECLCLDEFNWDAVLEDIDATEELPCLDSTPESDDQEKVDRTIDEQNHQGHFSCSEHEIMGFFNCSSENEYRGLRLLHLLLACAQGISDGASDVAEVTLCRLRELVSPTGSVMERVSFYLYNSLIQWISPVGQRKVDLVSLRRSEHFMGAFSLLHQACPYIRMAHFTANQSIMEALMGASHDKNSRKRIHIVDFDIMEGMQWPPLMEALNYNKIAVGHLRITAIKWGEDKLMAMQTGRRLCEYAESLGIPFAFHEKELKDLKSICLEEEEIVMANCMIELPHMSMRRSKAKVSEFIHGISCLRHAILTVGLGAPYEYESTYFFSRFVQCLQYSCAMVDSLEAEVAEHLLARAMIERTFTAPMVMRALVCQEKGLNVTDVAFQSGFKFGVLSEENRFQARALISRQAGKYYGLEGRGDGGLCLTWASIPLLCVYVWDTPSPGPLGANSGIS
ncbi:hypothetical protein SUGI_0133490 [Cryptomeria japonica]|uniref:protein NODULATION SIGNALING PATHWAY 2-like n=1 Tax=Cryptomeria japonica TaxID=3369 RepID=UPI0024089595|nr:protein NODULATION SIGNALING PATHWAY 2-like [Cryptomeria japonica]GLJ10707.1 hypothetical protein SUGI_0133490 [Cryptomeria japonica]